MSNFLLTPEMSLPNPVPGVDPGPDYAVNIENCFDIIDGHNHSVGSGNQINPDGIVINADLPFGGNNATLLRSVRFSPQSAPLDGAQDLGCLYESGGEAWYNDASGNQVQLTAGGLVNATSSGISSPPASASFVGSVLVVNENTNTPGNIQAGSILIGNNTVSSNFVTLSAPNALAADYPIVFPAALPGATSFVALDSSGNVSSSIPLLGSLTTANLSASAGITSGQIANGAINTANIANGAVTAAKLANANIGFASLGGTITTGTSPHFVGSSSITASGTRTIQVMLYPNGAVPGGIIINNTGGNIQTTGHIIISDTSGGSYDYPIGGFNYLAGTAQGEWPISFVYIVPAGTVSSGTFTASVFIKVDAPSGGTSTIAISASILSVYEIGT